MMIKGSLSDTPSPGTASMSAGFSLYIILTLYFTSGSR